MRSAYLIALLALASCDPVKRLQRDEDARVQVERYLLARGLCRPDTLRIQRTDTVVRVDTVGEIVIWTDTTYLHDTLRIRIQKLREVQRTMTIRDTLWQTIFDRAREQSLVVELSDCRAENEAYARSQKVMKWAATGLGLVILLALILAIKLRT
jgi:hypothetical protein